MTELLLLLYCVIFSGISHPSDVVEGSVSALDPQMEVLLIGC